MLIGYKSLVMKNKIYLKATGLLLLILFYLPSFGQLTVGYENGIVELNNRQTVVGYIKKEPLPAMLSKISFKPSLTDEQPRFYDTAQIRRFWIGPKETFEVLRFSVNGTPSISQFAQLVVRGDASLFKTFYQGDVLYLVRKDNRLVVLQKEASGGGNNKTPMLSASSKEQLKQVLGQPVATSGNSGNLAFSEKTLMDVVATYNSSVGAPNDVLLAKEAPVSFLLATVGGGLQQNDGKEFFIHSAYRVYFPELSRQASLNVGFNFYASTYTETLTINLYNYDFDYTSLLFAVPVEVQYNLLSRNIRPFVSAGFTMAYNSVKDQYGNAENRLLKNNFGVRPVYSGGVEVDFGKKFMAKAAYRKEIFSHLALVGLGYRFSK